MNNKVKSLSLKIQRKLLAPIRKKSLDRTDFTILSNNCWAGHVYRYFDLPYSTPTVGLFFYAPDYIKLINNAKYYFAQELKFISYERSKYRDDLIRRGYQQKPIGMIGDVEIIFLHYSDENEAREKWERRTARMNFDNLIIKFSQQNLCTEKELKSFDELNFNKKLMFVNKPDMPYDCAVYYPGYEDKTEVENDTVFFDQYVDLKELINSPVCKYEN